MGTFHPQGLKRPVVLPRSLPVQVPFYYTDFEHLADISNYYTATRIGTTGSFVRRISSDRWLEWEVTVVGAVAEWWGEQLDITFEDGILTGDFEVRTEIRWEENANSDNMRIWIELYDINLVRRVQMGFADEWGAVTGSIGRTICGVSNETGAGTMPLVGSTKLRLVRLAGVMNLYYDGTLLLSQACNYDLRLMRLVWQTYGTYNSVGLKGGFNYILIN